jgi:hypothetical protein
MERWFVQRFEHRTHGFLYHSVDHVRDTESSLTTTCLWNPYAPDISGTIGTREQLATNLWQQVIKMFAHIFDALAIWTCGSLIRRHLSKRFP